MKHDGYLNYFSSVLGLRCEFTIKGKIISQLLHVLILMLYLLVFLLSFCKLWLKRYDKSDEQWIIKYANIYLTKLCLIACLDVVCLLKILHYAYLL